MQRRTLTSKRLSKISLRAILIERILKKKLFSNQYRINYINIYCLEEALALAQIGIKTSSLPSHLTEQIYAHAVLDRQEPLSAFEYFLNSLGFPKSSSSSANLFEANRLSQVQSEAKSQASRLSLGCSISI